MLADGTRGPASDPFDPQTESDQAAGQPAEAEQYNDTIPQRTIVVPEAEV